MGAFFDDTFDHEFESLVITVRRYSRSNRQSDDKYLK